MVSVQSSMGTSVTFHARGSSGSHSSGPGGAQGQRVRGEGAGPPFNHTKPLSSGSLRTRPGALPLLRGEPDWVPYTQRGQPPCLSHCGEVVHGAATGSSPGRIGPVGWSDDGTVGRWIEGLQGPPSLSPFLFPSFLLVFHSFLGPFSSFLPSISP